MCLPGCGQSHINPSPPAWTPPPPGEETGNFNGGDALLRDGGGEQRRQEAATLRTCCDLFVFADEKGNGKPKNKIGSTEGPQGTAHFQTLLAFQVKSNSHNSRLTENMFPCQLGKKKRRFTEVQGSKNSGSQASGRPWSPPPPAPPRPARGSQVETGRGGRSRARAGGRRHRRRSRRGTHPAHLPRTWERRPCSATCSPGAWRETLPYTGAGAGALRGRGSRPSAALEPPRRGPARGRPAGAARGSGLPGAGPGQGGAGASAPAARRPPPPGARGAGCGARPVRRRASRAAGAGAAVCVGLSR